MYAKAAQWLVNLAKTEANYLQDVNVNPYYAYQYNNQFDRFDLNRDGVKGDIIDFVIAVANANKKNTQPIIHTLPVYS